MQPNLPTRNNNPGDLKDPSTGSFKQFSDPKQGYAALLNDLSAKQQGTTTTGLGPSSTVVDFAKKYAPSSDNNNTAKYAADLANQMGVAPDAQLKDLDLGKWASAVSKNEGYQGTSGQQVDAVSGGGNVQLNSPDLPAPLPPGVDAIPQPQGTLNGYPPPTPPSGSQQPQQNEPKPDNNIWRKIADIAFPIAGDVSDDISGANKKSVLQQIGDAGLSALWFLPFGDIAEGAGIGLKALGVGEKAAETAGLIGTGVGTGYASDVASNASQGQTGAGLLKPGLGTAIGGALPVGGMALGGALNKIVGQQNAVDKVTSAYQDALGATKSGVKAMGKGSELSSKAEFLANAGITPETEEINGTRKFATGENSQSQKTIQGRIKALSDLRDQAIEKPQTENLGEGMSLEGPPPTTDIAAMRAQALKNVENNTNDFSGSALKPAQDAVNEEFDLLEKQYASEGTKTSLANGNIIKKYLQGATNYDQTRPALTTKVFKAMAAAARGQVETDAEKAGVPGLHDINAYIQQHIDAIDTLNKINGQTIKGGRLGTYVKEGIGGAVGGSAAGALGGGLIGSAVGTLGGAYAGHLVSKWLQKLAVGGPMTAATIGRMASEDPEVVQQLLAYLGKEGEKIAPKLQPVQKSSAGLVGNILNKTPGSLIMRGAK